jgi:H+/gluconate symporter-like permease
MINSVDTPATIMMGYTIPYPTVTAMSTVTATLSTESFAPDAHYEGSYQEKQERHSKQCHDRSESLIHLSMRMIER